MRKRSRLEALTISCLQEIVRANYNRKIIIPPASVRSLLLMFGLCLQLQNSDDAYELSISSAITELSNI
ncbi:unnamed protein product [Ceratitis capitata]|uniref:(Mediterranean fruit fly) hypothetical protein n=1 Tax=Ceratitis capitata TaxID=7213 RepID=A0A811V5X3_CERCA|nr:unnamed protein product [Ceratitis capitata]